MVKYQKLSNKKYALALHTIKSVLEQNLRFEAGML